MNETDERKGCTSASNAQADLFCPGRHLAQRGIPDQPPGDDAAFGQAIHDALNVETSNSARELTNEQHSIFESCREIEKQKIVEFFGDNPEPKKIHREQRLWCRIPGGKELPGSFEHSAKPDLVVVQGHRGLIIEYKTLPGDVPASPSNLQLRDQAVLASRVLVLTEVGTAVVQPLVTHQSVITTYDQAALDRSELEMFERVRKSNDPDSKRVPGDIACKFCRATPICQEYAVWAHGLLPASPALPGVPVRDWTPEQRATFCDRRGAAAKWLDDCTEEMKSLLAKDPTSIPGWELEPGNIREKVVQPQALYDRFVAAGGTLPQFMKCVGITKKDLEEQVRAVTKLKGKGLKDRLIEMLAGLTEKSQNAPSLAKKK